MAKIIRRFYYLGALALLLALLLALSPTSSKTSHASSAARGVIAGLSHVSAASSSPWRGITTGWANVRTGPNTGSSVATVYAPGTTITVYATVSGEVVWGGISSWYRVSKLNSKALYVYGGLVNATSNPGGGNPSPSSKGKEILIVLSRQWMYDYQNGKLVYSSPITSGRPELFTPPGTYHVLEKLHPTVFYSPWPPGSPYYYPPTDIQYALEFDTIGLFLHDSYWRGVYGPGTNVWHNDPISGWITGTHGCVTMPLNAVIWLYNWAPVGTLVQINP